MKKAYLLRDVVNIKYGKNQNKVKDEHGNIPILGTGGLMGYANKALYSKPSVLIGRKGSISKVKYVNEPFWTVDTLFYTEVDETKVYPHYLYYLLSLIDFNYYNEGTTIPSLRTETLNQIEIDLPDLTEQKKILDILECIDKKIESNSKLNENLGQLLQSIYNISFSKLESLGKVYDLGYIQGGYAFKSKSLIDDKTDYKIIKIKNISENSVDMINTQYISKEVFDSTNKKFVLDDGEVVVAMTGAELGKTGIINNDDWITLLNQRVGVVRSESSINKHYLRVIFLSKAFQQKLNDMGYGSAQPNISSSDMENIEIIIPEENLLNEFYQQTKDIYQKQIEIEKENRKLYLLRDSLLPKLMSEEIEIKNTNRNIK